MTEASASVGLLLATALDERSMLGVFGHPVAPCWVLLAKFAMVKFEPTPPNMSQQVATGWPNMRNILRPTMWTVICCVDIL